MCFVHSVAQTWRKVLDDGCVSEANSRFDSPASLLPRALERPMTQRHLKPGELQLPRAPGCVWKYWWGPPLPQFAPEQGTSQPASYMRLFQSSPQVPQSLPDQQQNWPQLSPEASLTSSDTGASFALSSPAPASHHCGGAASGSL